MQSNDSSIVKHIVKFLLLADSLGLTQLCQQHVILVNFKRPPHITGWQSVYSLYLLGIYCIALVVFNKITL